VTEAVGWASSVVLLITIFVQVRKQWQSGSNKGVSKWLFIGQLAASVGFLTYSIITGSLVFAITNTMLTLGNLCGIFIFFKNR
jgi:MtN3 and saliva related transmembrane protein